MKLKTQVLIDELDYLHFDIDFSGLHEDLSNILVSKLQRCFAERQVELYAGESVGELSLLFSVGAGGSINAECKVNFNELVADLVDTCYEKKENHHLAREWARVFEGIANTLMEHASHFDAL
jgi:hypothetical protein